MTKGEALRQFFIDDMKRWEATLPPHVEGDGRRGFDPFNCKCLAKLADGDLIPLLEESGKIKLETDSSWDVVLQPNDIYEIPFKLFIEDEVEPALIGKLHMFNKCSVPRKAIDFKGKFVLYFQSSLYIAMEKAKD